MTILIVLVLCVAGFFLGFIVLYTMRRRRGIARPASQSQEIDRTTEQTPCLWCGSNEYSVNNPAFICPKCGMVHHRSCWEEYGGCTTWECPLAPTGGETKVAIVRPEHK